MPVAALSLLLLATAPPARATITSCLYCTSEVNQPFYDKHCAEGAAHITRQARGKGVMQQK
jgi:hypothetical protein